jgi:PAS domain S-box-containing protein
MRNQDDANEARGALRRRAQELEALQATVLDITVPHDLPTLLKTIVERAARLLSAPIGGLYLCDPDQRQVRCVVSQNALRDYCGTVLQYGEGAAGFVAQTGEPLIIEDYAAWPGRAAAFEEDQPFGSVLAVPMLWQGQVIGVIDVVHRKQDPIFTQADLDLLAMFANHAAIAVENTRLYEQAQDEIAERRRLEKQSEERRLYLEQVLNCAPDAIVALDAQHRVLEWNPGAEKLFGYSSQEVSGQDLDELIAAYDTAIFDQATDFTARVLSGDSVPPTETTRFRKDGTPIDVRLAGAPILVQGDLVGTVAVYTDITERKRSERSLAENESKYRTLFEASTDAIFVETLDGTILDCNASACEMFGYAKEELIGKSATALVPNEFVFSLSGDAGSDEIILDELFAEDGTVSIPAILSEQFTNGTLLMETINQRKDGETFPTEVSARLVILGGEPYLIVYVRDIAEKKRAEKALLESEERYRTLVENIPLGVYRTTPGPDGALLMANPAFLDMFGIDSGDDLARMRVADLYLDPTAREEFSDTVLARESVTGVELKLKKLYGTPIWGSVTAKAVYDEGTGEVAWFDCTIEDITVRKRSDEIQGLLYRIANAVHTTKDEEGLFTTIQQELGTLLDTKNFFIALYDKESDSFSLPYFVDEKDHFPTFPAGKTLTAHVIRKNQSLLVTRQEIEALVEAGTVELVGTASEIWLGVPLEVADEVIGALVVQSYADEMAYGQAELEILEFVSSQVGLAIERVRGEAARAAHARQQAALYQLSASLSASLDEDEICRRVVDELHDRLGYDYLGLFLVDEATGDRVLRACVGWLDAPPDWRLRPGQGLSERSLLDGQLHYTSDVAGDPRYITGIPGRSEVDVPLRIGEKVIGVLVVESKRLDAFDQDDFSVLAAVANQAAIALGRAREHEAVKQAEVRYQSLFDRVPIGLYRTTPEGRFLDVNAALVEMLGYPDRQELLKASAVDLYLDVQDRHRWQSLLERKGTVRSFETQFCQHDGTVFWVRETSRAVCDDAGKMLYYEGSMEDITDRIQAEGELRRLKEFNESIVQNMAEGIAVQDAQGYFTFVNPAAAAMLGYQPEELVGKIWTLVVPPDQQPIVQVADRRRLQGESDRYEVELVHRDGTRLPVLISGSPLYGTHNGQFAGTLAVFTDISERVRAEARLARHAREMAALYETALEINAQPDLPALLEAIVRRASELLGARMGGLYLMRSEDDELELVVSYNLPGDHVGTRLGLGEGLSGRVAQTGEPLMINDYSQWEGRAVVYDAHSFTRVLGVPLKVGDRIVGVINVTDAQPAGSFDADEIRLVSLFADQAAIAVESARLFEAEREQRELAEALRQATSAVSSTLDLEQILDRILEQVDRVIPGDAANISLIEGDVARIVRCRGYGRFGPDVQGFSLHLDETPSLSRMRERGQALVIPDVMSFPGWLQVPQVAWIRSYAAAPIRVRDDIIGFLNVDSAMPGFFEQAHLDRLRAFADQASVALENARLYEEAQRRNRELALLNRVTAASANSQAIEPLLAVVCKELIDAFNVLRASAALFNAEKTGLEVVAECVSQGPKRMLGKTVASEDDPACRDLLRCQAPLIITTAQADSGPVAIRELMDLGETTTLLFLPLIVEGEVTGGLALHVVGPRVISPGEIDLGQRVANQVSSALARARLEETQRRLIAAVEQAAEAVIIADTESNILYANPAFERITGYSRVEFIGKRPHWFGSDIEGPGLQQGLWKAVVTGQIWQGRFVHKGRDGSAHVVDSTVTPVRNHTGETVNLVATMRDVTREVHLEEQFQQAQKMEALGRLAGGIAHDFNNLLTVIHLSTRLLERQLRSEDPLWEHVQHIRQVGERAAKLTKQLLSFSRREVIEPHVMNLNQVVEHLSQMLQRIIGEDVDLIIDLAEDLWAVEADPAQMEQVLMNLAVNARDAMPGGGTLQIETANITLDNAYVALHVDARPGDHVVLTVRDTGAGMNGEVMAHLFEPFFTTKGRGQGTGLGLSTVFGIVKQSGGHIRVESEVAKGTVFEIYLARADGASFSFGAGISEPDLADPIETRETVLVVEDDESVRDLAVRVLISYGYQVLEAESGQRALQLSEQHDGPIDLLLTDVIMPHMNGKELCDLLQLERPELRVVFMSGYADNTILRHGALPPGTVFLSKPFSVEDLIHKVRSLLDARTGTRDR